MLALNEFGAEVVLLSSSWFSIFLNLSTNVLKTGPDRPVRPVEPSTGDLSGSVQPNEPFYGQTGIKPVKPPVEPPNRSNRPVFYEPAKLFFSLFYKYLLLL